MRTQGPIGRTQDLWLYEDTEAWEYATIYRGGRTQNLGIYENAGEPFLEETECVGNQGFRTLSGRSILFGEPVSNIL